jgi:hypothetical protein
MEMLSGKSCPDVKDSEAKFQEEKLKKPEVWCRIKNRWIAIT